MQRVQTILRWVTAAVLIAFIALIAGKCSKMYYTGMMYLQNTTSETTAQIYHWAEVREEVASLSMHFLFVLLLTSITAIVCAFSKEPVNKHHTNLYRRKDVKHHRYASIGIYVLAAVLIVLGISNGGLNDVLVKAINICSRV